jgi:trans-2,3-dihydro-3-hydroxyanthranilate isomerase
MQLDYHILDVFTEQRFGGNPLAVVLEADVLDGARMQTIAREFNLSETIFVLKPENRAHTARVRIFTPAAELHFAGHPTVGCSILLAELRSLAGGNGDAIIVLEEGAGAVRVGVRMQTGASPFAEFDPPRRPEEVGAAVATDRLAAAIGLMPGEIGFENHRPSMFGAGNTFAFVPVASLAAIGKARVSQPYWDAALGGQTGAFLYCRQTVRAATSFHARMFAPHHGVPEDPATGSAAAAFAGVIHRFDAPPDGAHKRVIEQGLEMGRPSLIWLSLEVEGGRLVAARVGGHAVRVAHGSITV